MSTTISTTANLLSKIEKVDEDQFDKIGEMSREARQAATQLQVEIKEAANTSAQDIIKLRKCTTEVHLLLACRFRILSKRRAKLSEQVSHPRMTHRLTKIW